MTDRNTHSQRTAAARAGFPYCPTRNAEKPTGADKLAILREEDTSVSPPLQDQGGRFTVAIPC